MQALGLSQYGLSKQPTGSPPCHVTSGDIHASIERAVVDRIGGHQLLRSRGGKIAVVYQMHWRELLRVNLEREVDLRHFCRHMLLHWVSDVEHHRPLN